jgi:hypothetical protein
MFKFFSTQTSPSQPASAAFMPSMPTDPAKNSPDEQSETWANEFDALAPLLPDDPATEAGPNNQALTSETHQASPHASAPGTHRISRRSRLNLTAMEDLRTLFRETETALERSKKDASVVELQLIELRSIGSQLYEAYTRLGETCRETEIRSNSAVEALNAIEYRLDRFETVRELTHNTDDRFASLKQLAEEVRHRAADFQTQKESIDRVLAEVSPVTELLAALEARVTKLTAKNEVLERAEATVGDLERRAAETTAHLERRVNDFDAQESTFEKVLAETARLTTIVSALDARVTTLTGPRRERWHAKAAVDHLQRRVVEATAAVKRSANEFDAKKRIRFSIFASSCTNSALALARWARRTAVSAARRSKYAVAMLLECHTYVGIPHVIAAKAPAVTRLDTLARAAWRRARKARLSFRGWEPLLGVLAVLALLGVIMVRSRGQAVPISTSAVAADRNPLLTAAASVPPDPVPRFAFDTPAGRGAGPNRRPANEAASDARPSKRHGQPPQSVGAAAGQSGRAASTGTPRPSDSSRHDGSVKETIPGFTGVLAIDSDPSGGVVFVDREHVGETPIRLTRLRAGSHVIWVEHDGYDRWTTAALVPAYKQTRVRAKLEPAR